MATLREVYGTDADGRDNVDDMDLLVGTSAEGHRPTGFGFGETLFQIFILNASLAAAGRPVLHDRLPRGGLHARGSRLGRRDDASRTCCCATSPTSQGPAWPTSTTPSSPGTSARWHRTATRSALGTRSATIPGPVTHRTCADPAVDRQIPSAHELGAERRPPDRRRRVRRPLRGDQARRRTARPTSWSSRRARTSAAPGATTPTPAPPATCPASSTRSRFAPQPRLVPLLLPAAGDPGLPRARRRASPACSTGSAFGTPRSRTPPGTTRRSGVAGATPTTATGLADA